LATLGQKLLPENKGGMLRTARDRTNELITEAEVLSTFPFIGTSVSETLQKMHIDPTSLLKIRRRCKVLGSVSKSGDASTNVGAGNGLELVTLSDAHLDRSDKEYVKRTQDFWYPHKSGDERKTETSDATGGNNDVEAGGHREREFSEVQILIEHPTQQNVQHRVSRRDIVRVEKDDESAHYFDLYPVPEGEVICNGDILFFTHPQALMKNQDKSVMQGLKIIDANVLELAGFGTDLAELAISDSNPYLGRTLYNSDFGKHYGVSILAIRSRGSDDSADVQELRNNVIRAGDIVLVVANNQTLDNLKCKPWRPSSLT
jgi:hypothetical protein